MLEIFRLLGMRIFYWLKSYLLQIEGRWITLVGQIFAGLTKSPPWLLRFVVMRLPWLLRFLFWSAFRGIRWESPKEWPDVIKDGKNIVMNLESTELLPAPLLARGDTLFQVPDLPEYFRRLDARV